MAIEVQLVVTGAMEWSALGPSLGRLFGTAARFRPARFVDSSFTSCAVQPLPARTGGKKPTAVRLAEKLVGLCGGGPGPGMQAADLVMAVVDLELANSACPCAVVDLFASAVRMVAGNSSAAAGSLAILQQRASFHLLAPMAEAYFFGEQRALNRAGSKRASSFNPDLCDVERFRVKEPGFFALPGGRPVRTRRRHPKEYLDYLCGGWGTYRETTNGARALEELDWRNVLKTRCGHARFAQALVDDIADAAGASGLRMPEPHELLRRRPGGLLRNL